MIGGNLRQAATSPAYAEEARTRVDSLQANDKHRLWRYGKRPLRSVETQPSTRKFGQRPPPAKPPAVRVDSRSFTKRRLAELNHPTDEGEYIEHRWPQPVASPIRDIRVAVAIATYAGDWHKLPESLAALAESEQPGLSLEVSIAVNHEDFTEARELVE
ncbi:MAG: hypothetical protein ACRDTD_31590, partial [Pseudonocardiaceae bacterium]